MPADLPRRAARAAEPHRHLATATSKLGFLRLFDSVTISGTDLRAYTGPRRVDQRPGEVPHRRNVSQSVTKFYVIGPFSCRDDETEWMPYANAILCNLVSRSKKVCETVRGSVSSCTIMDRRRKCKNCLDPWIAQDYAQCEKVSSLCALTPFVWSGQH